MQQYNKASEEYYITANTVLNLAQRAHEIFLRSETEEKRQLLKFVFQNMELNERNLVFTIREPFKALVDANVHHSWGG